MLIRDLPAKSAIKFGKLFYKPNSINSIISKTCRLVLLEADDLSLPLGRTGTCTLVKYRDNHYVIMTRHELDWNVGVSPNREMLDTIRPTELDSKTNFSSIPLDQCYFESSNPDLEYHDLVFFKVQKHWEGLKREAQCFSPVVEFSKNIRLKSWIIGCPILPIVMDGYWNAHSKGKIEVIKIKTSIGYCTFSSDSRKGNYLREYTNLDKNMEMNGMSGGAIYSLVQNEYGYQIVLDGITVRAGNGNAYIVDSDYILMMLQKIDLPMAI